MGALAHAVSSGKALYAGLSNYSPAETVEAAKLLRDLGTPCLVHQPRYSMFDRRVEPELLATLAREQIGGGGLLAPRQGAADRPLLRRHSRRFAGRARPAFLKPADITDDGGREGQAAQ